ncbi:MAG: ABC transporter ATP-binding protein [Hyphomicrobiaceae bacterium]|nr:ABC transporter ATP-binding protein [Hyphomicrobiaceae bacterium]
MQVGSVGSDAREIARAGDFVRFDKVEKSYDGRTLVVRQLDLLVARGEFLTLLGPSGSGKTTTLMMLAGFETPTRGLITLEGRDITRVPPHKRGLGMVFQNYALFPHMSVRENLAFPLEVRGVSRAEIGERVTRALDMVRLGKLGDRRPGQLSGGQQQRIALARALVFEPKLVLMDEPLGALDKQLREHMQYEIKHLHERLGVTVVYVTHDQGEALTMSDRVAVFNDGRIQQIDRPRTIYEHPDTAFVAQFIGENNKVDGTVTALGVGEATVTTAAGQAIRAEAGPGLSLGGRALVSLRPERLSLAHGADAVANHFPGTVVETIYHGDHLRVRLEALGRDDFVVKAPVSGSEALVPGRTVDIGWRVADGRALPIETPA